MNIILLGGPGAGKGTQAEKLVNEFGMLHISTGDLLRDAVAKGSDTGLKAKEYMDNGNLVPDNLILKILEEKLTESDLSNGLILDGFPRTVDQATELDKIMERINSAIDLAILIDTPEDVIIQRICSRRTCRNCGKIGSVNGLNDDEILSYKCPECGGEMYQRADDNEATVKNRIDVYNTNTAPLIDFYKKQNKLKQVNGAAEYDGKNDANAVYHYLRELIK